ncbi:CbrC family protein (plasmid) [Streptomyces sp. NBC_01450]
MRARRLSEETLEQVTRRTPGFHAWQDPYWLVHCNDAAAFIGEVGSTGLAAHPEALDPLRLDLRMAGSQGHPVQRRVRDGVRTTSVRVALAPSGSAGSWHA